jgi:hypothetical protein
VSQLIPADLREAIGHCVNGRWRSLARQQGLPECTSVEPLLVAIRSAAAGGAGALPEVSAAFAHLDAARQWLVLGELVPALRALRRYLAAIQSVLEGRFGAVPAALRHELEGGAEPLLHILDSQLALQRLLRAGALAPQLTIVLGMHRSGTSALSGLLCRSGWDPPVDLLPSSAHNPLGYWESLSLMRRNDRLLQGLDRSWCSPEPLPAGWEHGDAARAWRRDLLDLLPAMFGSARRPLLKDPRLCLLFPALIPWLECGDLEVFIPLCLRHPFEVGRSLGEREAMPPEVAVQLWLSHTFEAERLSRGHQREWVRFRRLLDQPRAVLARCRLRLGIAVNAADSVDNADMAIDPGLHRQRLDQVQPAALAEWLEHCKAAGEIAMELHTVLHEGLADQPKGRARIDLLRRRWLASVNPSPELSIVHQEPDSVDDPS